MNVVVNVQDFIDHLKQENLVIVPKTDIAFEKKVELLELKEIQKKLLKKPALSPLEIVRNKLTHYTTVHSVKKSKYIKAGELFKGKDGKWKIATCAVNRIREIKHL